MNLMSSLLTPVQQNKCNFLPLWLTCSHASQFSKAKANKGAPAEPWLTVNAAGKAQAQCCGWIRLPRTLRTANAVKQAGPAEEVSS